MGTSIPGLALESGYGERAEGTCGKERLKSEVHGRRCEKDTIPQVVVELSITPNRFRGRMKAIMIPLVWGTMAVGAMIRGILGESIGTVNPISLGGLIAGTSGIGIIPSKSRHRTEETT
jgi:hypothetical protein